MANTTIASRNVTETGVEIVSAPTWSQVSLSTKAPGISISSSSGNSDGMPLGETPLSLILGPNDRIFGFGPNGAVIGYSLQPLPWIERAILGAARALGF
jgi:hypothetical protein